MKKLLLILSLGLSGCYATVQPGVAVDVGVPVYVRPAPVYVEPSPVYVYPRPYGYYHRGHGRRW